VLTIILTVLSALIFYPSRRRERGVVVPHKRATTPRDEKWAPALRVTPEKTPGCVVRRSFGTTKRPSSCLAWRFFRHNRIVNTP